MKKLLQTIAALAICMSVSAQWTDKNSGITNDLNSVFFIDSNNGWAVGRQGKIIRTTDGGNTWLQQNSGTTNDLNKVFMVDAGTGYAVGKSGTCLKYNGSSWSALSIGFSQAMHGVYFLNANTGWISGDWGRIMMTTNGGSSWTTQVNNSQYSNLFYDLHMLSTSEGWAVGTSGRVLKYNGTNWSNVTNPATADLYSVHFSSSSNGFITGKNSTVLYYNGSSWTTHNTALPDNSFHVYDVHVVNNNLAYAATTPGFGGAGIILKYDGSFWNKDYEYTGMFSELFYGIHINSSGSGFAVGAGGMIKKNTNAAGGSGIFSYSQGNVLKIKAQPNPFTDETLISFFPANNNPVNVSIYNLIGETINSFTVPANQSKFRYDGAELDAGIYFISIASGSHKETVRVVKTE